MHNEWDYDVGVRDLKTVDKFGEVFRKKRATIDTKTGDILGLVSNKFNPVQNKTVHDIMEEVSSKIGLKLKGITVVKDKAATIFKYDFGKEQNRVVSNSHLKDDVISFGLEIFNSFDSSLGSSRFMACANRLSCLNGMTVPKEIGRMYFSDFEQALDDGPTGLNVVNVEQRILNRLDPICNTVKTWEKWADITPCRTKVGELIAGNLSEKQAQELLTNYDASDDRSLWALYNMVTYFITHEVESKNPYNTRLKQYNFERLANKFYTEDLA